MAKNLELQSKNYTQIEVVAGADIVDGDLQTSNELYGFPMIDVLSGELYALITKAEKVKAVKTAAIVFAPGEAAYWVVATKDVTNVAGANLLIGYAYEAAIAGATHINIVLDGAAAFEKL